MPSFSELIWVSDMPAFLQSGIFSALDKSLANELLHTRMEIKTKLFLSLPHLSRERMRAISLSSLNFTNTCSK